MPTTRTPMIVAATLVAVLSLPAYAILDDPTPGFDVVDNASYQALVDAGVAAEVVRLELSLDPNPRLVAGAVLLAVFSDRNPLATPAQQFAYVAAVDSALASAAPSDPNLILPANLLPALRFSAQNIGDPTLDGLDLRVGEEALGLLGLTLSGGARSARIVDFEQVQAMDYANHSATANVLIASFLDRTPSGAVSESLSEALDTLLIANGINAFPVDLAGAYPEIATGMAGLPADFAAFSIAEGIGFSGQKAAVDSEFSVLGGSITANQAMITSGLVAFPDQFEAATRASDPVLAAQIQQDQLDATRARAQSRSRLALNTLLLAQGDAGTSQFAREARDFSDTQLQVDKTLDTIGGVLEIGGNLALGVAGFYSGQPAAGVGGILLALGGVFGLVDDSTPTPDAQIFSQIVQLRQQVEDLRVEMHTRFDSIDRQLDIIYQAMSSGLNQINETTMQIDANVQALQVDLYELKSALNQLEANLYGVLSAGFEQDFIIDMETGLGYRDRTGVDLKFTGQGDNTFFAFNSRFAARATTIATGETYAGPVGLSFSNDGTAVGALQSFPLGYNINNLRQFPSELGLPLWSFGRVANPTTWSFAADAYAQLAQENPWYFAKVHENDPSRLAQIISAGESVRTMMRGARNRDLFEALINQYKVRVGALHNEISLEAYNARNGYSSGLDPFAGIGQDMKGVGPPLSIIYSSVGTPMTPWFDPTLVWELTPPKIGLASAAGVTGWEASRWRWSYRNTVTELLFPEPTHRVNFAVRDLQGSQFDLYFKYYEFVGGEPADFRQWMLDNGDAVDFLFRATVDGEQLTTGGYTIRYRGDDFNIGPIPQPSDLTVNNALAAIADDYWLDTNARLSSSTTLDLLGAMESSQELLAAYTALGLPNTLAQNDLVRATVRGAASERSGLGGEWIDLIFNDAFTLGISPPVFRVALQQRADLFLEQIGMALDRPDHEPHAYLRWSLKSLKDLEANALSLLLDDTYAVVAGQSLVVSGAAGVLANDAQQPGADIIATVIFPTLQGSLLFSTDGGFSYTPNPGFVGIDSFRYIATANLADPGNPPNLVSSGFASVVIMVQQDLSCRADVTTTDTNPGDTNYGSPDGAVNGADLSFFVEAWLSLNVLADMTTTDTNPGDTEYGVPDGWVNGADLSFYVELWLSGCP